MIDEKQRFCIKIDKEDWIFLDVPLLEESQIGVGSDFAVSELVDPDDVQPIFERTESKINELVPCELNIK